MDYSAAIERVYDHVESDRADKAVMGCLRIARHLQDYFYVAVFLREIYPDKREFVRVFVEDAPQMNAEHATYFGKKSLEIWLDTHQVDDTPWGNDDDDDDDRKNILLIAVGNIDPELRRLEQTINDLVVPTGMGEYETAETAKEVGNTKAYLRWRMNAIETIKQRIRARCLNYAIGVERQTESQSKTRNFVTETHTLVNNYIKVHSEDVDAKLQKAAQLIDSSDPEDFSLVLAHVRRAIKAVADYFYPATGIVKCADGEERKLDDEKYLNRLQEYLSTTFDKSSSRDLLQAELDYFGSFARRLNGVASKGVHSEVSAREAKQGLLGLYMLLYDIVLRLQENEGG
jgi:hypothetical protein